MHKDRKESQRSASEAPLAKKVFEFYSVRTSLTGKST